MEDLPADGVFAEMAGAVAADTLEVELRDFFPPPILMTELTAQFRVSEYWDLTVRTEAASHWRCGKKSRLREKKSFG